jgi:hypothetical protein
VIFRAADAARDGFLRWGHFEMTYDEYRASHPAIEAVA